MATPPFEKDTVNNTVQADYWAVLKKSSILVKVNKDLIICQELSWMSPKKYLMV